MPARLIGLLIVVFVSTFIYFDAIKRYGKLTSSIWALACIPLPYIVPFIYIMFRKKPSLYQSKPTTKNKFCTKCGKDVSLSAKTCSKCGNQLTL